MSAADWGEWDGWRQTFRNLWLMAALRARIARAERTAARAENAAERLRETLARTAAILGD